MRKYLIALMVGLLAAIAIGQAPAYAAYSDCAAYPGTICFHEHSDFTGQVWRQYPWQIAGGSGCRNVGPDGFDNEASTAFNLVTHSYSVRVWQWNNCTGDSFILAGGQYYNFAGNWWNDRISAIEVIAA